MDTEVVTFAPKWWVYEALCDFRTKVFFASGGLGAGKTDGLAAWHHDRVTRNPRSKFSWFFEPVHARIEDAALPKYQKNLTRLGYVEGRDYKITKSPFVKLKYIASGQEVHFHSFERPDLIVAVEISHGSIDECALAQFSAYQNVRARIRCPDANYRQLFCAGAPQGINWYAEIADSDTLPGWDTDVPRDHVYWEKGYRRFILWTDDNADNLPDDYISNLVDTFGHNPNLLKSYRFGQFCPLTEGAAYSNYMPQKHDIDDIECDPYLDIHLTFDFNANPVSWISLQRRAFTEHGYRIFRWVATHESNDESTQLDDAVVEFAQKHPVAIFKKTPIKIWGDRSGHSGSHKIEGSDYDNIEKYLRELGYQNIEICAPRQVAPETDSVDAVQRLFLNTLILLCRRLKGLRKSLMATVWRPGQRKLLKPKGETHTHKSDALKYFAWAEALNETGRDVRKIYGKN